MTKIKNYPLDLDINGSDKWIGTDSASLAKLTKNFTPDNLAKYYNDKEVVESVNQLRFFYDTVDPGDDRASGSFSFPTEVGPTVPFSSISDLVFSKYTMGSDAVNNFMTDIVNSIIIIQKADNPDIYAFYALNGYEVDPSNPDFYNVTLSFESGNGSVEEDEDYLVSLIQFAGAAGIQTILGSEFIDSTLTGVGEVTISLSATGTPSNLTGLRGDNTWGTLGLEALDEGGRNSYLSTDAPIGWRLIGRDPSLYGNIGEDAIDFSTGYFQNETLPFGGSITNSPQIGSTGPGSFTLGNTVENNSSGGVVFGSANVLNGGPNIEPTYFVGGVVLGQYNQSYGLNYFNFTSGYKNLIGDRTQQSWTDAGFPSSWPVQYWSGQIGMYNQMPSGYASVQLGYGLLSGGPFCTTVGLANEDVTLTIAKNIVNDRNALNPRFIVGCGTFAGNTANPSVGVRQNGFVVMSDGTATFPILTNALIDAAGDDSAVTKGWVNSGPALTSEQVRIEVKNTSGVTLTKGTPVYITGTVGATVRAEVAAADASNSATMPAVGVLAQDLINNADGYAVTGGFLTNITTDPIDGLTPTENDTVYVKAGGGLTLTKPTGSDLIQNIAKVGKVSGGNAGSLVISSILRTNDVPNLTTGKIWVGTATNTAESTVVHLDESNGRMGIGTSSPNQKLDVVGDSEFNGEIRISSNNIHVNDKLLNIVDGGTGKEGIHIRTGQPTIDFQDWNTGGKGEITSNDGNISIQSDVTNTKASSNITFLVDTSERMRITDVGNVGIGLTSPATKLDVQGPASGYVARFRGTSRIDIYDSGTLIGLGTGSGQELNLYSNDSLVTGVAIKTTGQLDFKQYGSGTFTGTATQRLAVDSSGNVIEIPIGSGPVDGSGTANYVTKWSDADTITDSVIYDDGTRIGIGTTSLDSNIKVNIEGGGVKISGNSAGQGYQLSRNSVSGSFVTNGSQLILGTFSNNSLDLYTNSTAKIRITNTGNVGIGTTSPNVNLEVVGGTTGLPPSSGSMTYGVSRFTNGNAGDASIFIGRETSTNNVWIQSGVPSNMGISSNLLLQPNGVGNVGIGTTSPAYKLDVNGDIRASTNITGATIFANTSLATSYIYNGTASSLRLYNANAQPITFSTSASERMRITDTGNVGIGTTSPAKLLNLSGNNPDIRFDDTSALTRADLNTEIGFYDSTGANGSYIGHRGSADLYMRSTAGAIRLGTFADAQLLNLVGTNVGIGTTSPSYPLHVDGISYAVTGLFGIDGGDRIQIYNRAVNDVAVESFSAELFLSSGFNGISFEGSANTTLMKLTDSGRLGIGTTSPSAELDVVGNVKIGNNATIFSDGTITLDIDYNNNQTDRTLRVTQHGGTNELFRIQEDGNVGVGTATPAAKLDVNGGVRVADDATAASATNVGTLRYRTSGNNSYVDMCMQTGAATYAWVNIVQNNW